MFMGTIERILITKQHIDIEDTIEHIIDDKSTLTKTDAEAAMAILIKTEIKPLLLKNN